MKTKSGKPTRSEKVAALKEELAEFEEELDEEMRAEMYARVQGYSERNIMLIVMQRPDATEVRGFKAWLAVGRVVRKGESGIQILAPAGKQEKDENDPNSKERMFFRIAHVFDITQTDAIEQ